jgi:hypothetical protein
VILFAHGPEPGEARVTRLVRGRASMEMTRQVREEGFRRYAGPAGRGRRWRLGALTALILLFLAGTWLAGLIALSGGSLGLAFGVSGGATYLASHGEGAATFVRDPQAATANYFRTSTPTGMALDVGEFALLFAGSGGGAAAGRTLAWMCAVPGVIPPDGSVLLEGWSDDLIPLNPGMTEPDFLAMPRGQEAGF